MLEPHRDRRWRASATDSTDGPPSECTSRHTAQGRSGALLLGRRVVLSLASLRCVLLAVHKLADAATRSLRPPLLRRESQSPSLSPSPSPPALRKQLTASYLSVIKIVLYLGRPTITPLSSLIDNTLLGSTYDLF